MSEAITNPEAAGNSPRNATGADDKPGEARWRSLVAQVGVEIAGPLTAALERVHALTRTGRIDRANLAALREEVERARAVGMVGQQLARVASGQLRQAPERVELAQALRTLLLQRASDLQARSLALRPALQPVEVIVDAALLAGLLNSLLDWALAHARSQLELRLDTRPWPPHGRLVARFDVGAVDADPAALETLVWRLLQQFAWTIGLRIERRDEPSATQLTLEFPRTVGTSMEGVSAVELDPGFTPTAAQAKALAGNHVLVIAAERELRAEVCDAMRHLGLIVDAVASLEEAAAFCNEGLPHAIVFDGALRGEAFERLRGAIDAEAPEFVFIEIVEERGVFEISGFSGSGMARIGRDALVTALPSALLVELSPGL